MNVLPKLKLKRKITISNHRTWKMPKKVIPEGILLIAKPSKSMVIYLILLRKLMHTYIFPRFKKFW